MTRYRLRWSRTGKIRYLSAHDLAAVFERSTRRAKLPLAYSQGFSPHPKIGFATALPVGYASSVELMDITLTEPMAADDLVDRMNRALPEGLRVEGAALLGEGSVKLGRVAAAADYVVSHDSEWLPDAFHAFLMLDSLPFERNFKGSTRTDDLRPGVFEASSTTSKAFLRCALVPKAVRPTDVIAALARAAGREVPHVTVERVGLLHDGEEGLMVVDERGVSEGASR